MLEDIHSAHPVSFSMLSLAESFFWLYIHHNIIAKASECNESTDIGRNLKPVFLLSKGLSLAKCKETKVN